jgi:hypothetical protein
MALSKSEKTKRYRLRHPGLRADRDKKRYANRPEVAKRQLAASKAWKLAHPIEYKAWAKAWYVKNGERHKAACNKRNLTKNEKVAGRKKPKRCDVCKKSGKRICFDHCHKKGHFRGWLCSTCNWALGHVKDSSSLLRKLAAYIDADKVTHQCTRKKVL